LNDISALPAQAQMSALLIALQKLELLHLHCLLPWMDQLLHLQLLMPN